MTETYCMYPDLFSSPPKINIIFPVTCLCLLILGNRLRPTQYWIENRLYFVWINNKFFFYTKLNNKREYKKIKEDIKTETGRKKGSSKMGNLLFNVSDPFNQSDHLMSLNEENGSNGKLYCIISKKWSRLIKEIKTFSANQIFWILSK